MKLIIGIRGQQKKDNQNQLMKKTLTLKKTDTIRQAFELLKGQFGMIVCILENKEILSQKKFNQIKKKK